MDEEQLVLVDETDNPVGTAGKLECHTGEGKLHRAFTALVFDGLDRLFLTRRSDQKMLWPSVWDATFASHPRADESYANAAMRRMPDELGASCKMDYLLKFVYHVKYENIGSENEVCGVLVGRLTDASAPKPAAGEISEARWVTPVETLADIEHNPMKYCPWMLASLRLLERGRGVSEYADAVAPWMEEDAMEILDVAVRAHMDKSRWWPIE